MYVDGTFLGVFFSLRKSKERIISEKYTLSYPPAGSVLGCARVGVNEREREREREREGEEERKTDLVEMRKQGEERKRERERERESASDFLKKSLVKLSLTFGLDDVIRCARVPSATNNLLSIRPIFTIDSKIVAIDR